MPEVNCLTHSDKRAAGYCSRCQMPYCSDCLDVEMGQPLCVSCKKKFSQAAAPAQASGSPLNFKNKGLDDDLLNLFGAPAAPKGEPAKGSPSLIDFPISALASKVPDLSTASPAATNREAPPSLLPKFESPLSSPVSTAPPSLTPKPPIVPPRPLSAPAPTPKPSLDLDSLIPDPLTPRTPFPKAPGGPPPLTQAPHLSLSKDPMTDLPKGPPKKKNKFISLTKIWAKYLVRRSYEMFDPLAQKLKVPTYVFLAIVAAVITAAVIGIGALLNRPSVAMADTIPPIHIVQVGSGQISEMDVTTYTDLQNQIQSMGFAPLMQMTVPQIPSPNFFDVGIKDNIGIYSEILKTPGQITPHLSFVTVFTNGVWYSTNGWEGNNQQMEYLVSEFYPKDTPDQLYVKHVQGVEKLKQDKDWQVQTMNQNRYMAALSDHLRWFLNKKGIQGYKADFNLWH